MARSEARGRQVSVLRFVHSVEQVRPGGEALNAQQVFLSEQPENSLRRPRSERQKSSNERDNVTSRAKKPGNFTSITP